MEAGGGLSPPSPLTLTTVVYRGVHGTAPRYLSDLLHGVSDITSRRRLRSSTSSELVIPLSRLVSYSNVGDRSFAVAGPRLWNTLRDDITSVPYCLLVFRQKLKTHFVSAILSGHYAVACLAQWFK